MPPQLTWGEAAWLLPSLSQPEAAAKSRLEAVREKGVRTAQAGPRDTVVMKVSLQVREADAAMRAKLAEIAQQFPGSELRECPAPG